MSQDHKRVNKIIEAIESQKEFELFTPQVTPKTAEELQALGEVSYANGYTNEDQQSRLKFLEEKGITLDFVSGKKTFSTNEALKGVNESPIPCRYI